MRPPTRAELHRLLRAAEKKQAELESALVESEQQKTTAVFHLLRQLQTYDPPQRRAALRNLALLYEADGKPKKYVTIRQAAKVAKVTVQAINKAARRRKNPLVIHGTMPNRRVLVSSLIEHLPVEMITLLQKSLNKK